MTGNLNDSRDDGSDTDDNADASSGAEAEGTSTGSIGSYIRQTFRVDFPGHGVAIQPGIVKSIPVGDTGIIPPSLPTSSVYL